MNPDSLDEQGSDWNKITVAPILLNVTYVMLAGGRANRKH